MRDEQALLRLSIAATIVLAAAGVIVGLIAGSAAIVFDGVYGVVDAVMTILALLVAKLIATAAKQIALFLVILAIVSAAIVAFIIYTMTMGKIKEIAVLKLIGTRDRTIAAMILQEALGLGVIGFFVGKFAATLWVPVFPKHVLLETTDAVAAFAITLVICSLASVLAIRAALNIDPAEAISG